MKTLENCTAIDEARCLRPEQFGQLKGFATETVRRWCRAGVIPCIKVGRKGLMIPLQKAEAALAKLESGAQV